MSSRRIVLSAAMMALAVLAGSWVAAGAFPMVKAAAQEAQAGPGPLERRANPITPENPVPRRVYSVAAQYPPEALSSGVRGLVSLFITIDESGRVAEARKVGSMADVTSMGTFEEAFVESALEAVRRWQYEPPAHAPIAFRITLGFEPDAAATLLAQDTNPASVTTTPAGAPVTALPAPPWHVGALRVGGAVRPPQKVKDVRPIYPADALAAKVQGIVIVEARIEPDGRVSHTRVLRSIRELDQAALDAVRQWEFTPTLMNGAPMPVIMVVTIQFTLA